ncbi:MAG: ABC transporter permease subunit [Gammaproteobacteria bacterium]|nr:ABC transporter permease subunit [Gammaproteobacteria bacterium]
MPDTHTAVALPQFNTLTARRYRRWRHFKDDITRHVMAFGGIGVIIAIVLIAFYLLYIVLPMFRPAQIEETASYPLPGDLHAESLFYAMEEQHEIGLRITAKGEAVFFNTRDGLAQKVLPLLSATKATVSAFSAGDPTQRIIALGLTDGTVQVAQHNYSISYPNNVRLITPGIAYPFGETPIQVDAKGKAIQGLGVQADEEQITLVARTEDARLILLNLEKEDSSSEKMTFNWVEREIDLVNSNVTHVVLDIEQRELYVADDSGFISYFDISKKSDPRLIQRVKAVPEDVQITSLEFLSGGISILAGDTRGYITQWFPVRDEENNYTLEHIRSFDAQKAPIVGIAPEYFRKGFIAVDADGNLGVYHATAHRAVKLLHIDNARFKLIAVAPRANAAMIENAGQRIHFWKITNEHPEISWQSIWGSVWYESRAHPEFIWQSSSASSDFEPKFSLTPLAFGTLKASIYAMLFAIPLAIMGAIYTAYFMSVHMRGLVKPTIEIMAALPTVILGFIAGLWFAPYVEHHLAGILLLLVLIPAAILVACWLWRQSPAWMQQKLPEGWEAALLIPVIVFAIACSLWFGQIVESRFFDGNMPLWLGQEFGITYVQRNSLIVGIAIGFAVIPTIFSISEDAIFSVPKHLTTGSLALGATPWQTMMRVVLLTASPGIFSAVMIGLGRAVGETMIVVMATGNTAIMDMSIFQGFRALSANIAVEMPESEVGSTHYRILFLAGLVLFVATFVFNSIAEIVRQRLRTKYSNL